MKFSRWLYLFLLISPVASAYPINAVAVVSCQDFIESTVGPDLPSSHGRMYIPYVEHQPEKLLDGELTANCFKAIYLGCMPASGQGLTSLYTNTYEIWLNNFNEYMKHQKPYGYKCVHFPREKMWRYDFVHQPFTDQSWRKIPEFSFVEPSALQKWMGVLSAMQMLTTKYASASAIAAVAVIFTAAIASSGVSMGSSILAGTASVIAILAVYYPQFSEEDKKFFNNVKTEITAQVNVHDSLDELFAEVK